MNWIDPEIAKEEYKAWDRYYAVRKNTLKEAAEFIRTYPILHGDQHGGVGGFAPSNDAEELAEALEAFAERAL